MKRPPDFRFLGTLAFMGLATVAIFVRKILDVLAKGDRADGSDGGLPTRRYRAGFRPLALRARPLAQVRNRLICSSIVLESGTV